MKRTASAPALTDGPSKVDPKLQRSKTDDAVLKEKPKAYETQEYDSIVETIGKPNPPREKAKAVEQEDKVLLTANATNQDDDLGAMISEVKATAHLVCLLTSILRYKD